MPSRMYSAGQMLLCFGVAALLFAFCFRSVAICRAQDTGGLPAVANANEAAAPRHVEAATPAGILEAGFRNLYQLNFKEGRAQFLTYQKLDPDDPMGKAAEAASYLYEQFNA